MGHGSGIREVAWFDIAGGGQVVLDGNHAYIGHMDPPHGTSVLNVADPAHPRLVASIAIPPGLHSHKVRVANEVMVVNRERARGEKPADDFVGLRIFDVSRPASPRDICHWECAGMGVHRFTFDGRYAYISAELEGYIGTIPLSLVDAIDHPKACAERLVHGFLGRSEQAKTGEGITIPTNGRT